MSRAHVEAMRRAIALATPTRTHPNPRVGAVVIDEEGRILSEGAHTGPGHAHAERVALERLREIPVGATLVVTLEPCDHQGLTAPCSEFVVASGIRRVVVGARDPDPRVSGRGLERLRASGLGVEEGLLAEEVEEMDPAYFHHRRHGRAHVTLKRAMTLDGQTAAVDGSSRWITGAEARADAHLLRAGSDAVMVGAGTLRVDDPSLTVRLEGFEGPQPPAVVVAGDEALPRKARLWDRPDTLTVASRMIEAPGEVIVVDKGHDGLPDVEKTMVRLGERGLLGIVVEGGARLSSALWRAGIVDRGVTYVGGMVAGGNGVPSFAGPWETMTDARRAEILGVTRLGADIRIDWRPARQ